MKMTLRSLEVSCNKHVRKCYASAWLIGLSVLKESTINYPILSYPKMLYIIYGVILNNLPEESG